jgi:demethylmenaquinone methyltransferase/2-methoxy-6-polyprenyl-1,4-benzoquinol methylase
MLEQARQKYGADITYVRTAAEDMTFADHSFDLVVCYQVFPHFYDKAKALGNIYRVLKPGGKLVIAHGSSREAINNLHRETGGAVGQDRIPGAKTMQGLLHRAGFTRIVIHDTAEYYLASGEKPAR